MQAQRVLDALAKHWHPATAAEIAAATHLKVNAASTQLDRLVKDGTVKVVALPDTKRQGFQLVDRLFNLWCLMRAGRGARQQLLSLVQLVRRVLVLEYQQSEGPDVLRYVVEAMRHGALDEARTLLASGDAGEHWAPLHHALAVLEHGDASPLQRLAPEMREAVRLVLERISPTPAAPPPAAPPRSRRRRAR